MQIGSLQVALKQKNNNNVSGLSEELKVQNEQLNAKVIQLEKQLECCQNLELENQQLKEKLDVMKHMEDEFLNMVGALHMNVVEKERLLKDSEDFNQSLIIKEREINDELQNARKKLIELSIIFYFSILFSKFTNNLFLLLQGIAERSSLDDGNICVKQMGEIDTEPFLKAFTGKRRYNEEEAEQRALEKCSLWQKYLGDPHWYPFKIITIGGKSKEIINEEDERLKRLKREMGVGVYKAVVTALKEMNEYNPSGRFMVRELWNNDEGKRATLEEGIEFLLNQTKTKRRKIGQMDDGANENGDDDEVFVEKNKRDEVILML
ncbi:protein INVOLVED IN DE NOVO 2 [Cajanus cajan]|uniref:protein INVOLVED IN DE NOVO 2 n=1 Tax=Cajanus cajan TaxID=3821 RepID=UPI0010FB1F02|nr:protein INVOLVED IN DE NOVO 2 [Cajanus cajan]